MTARLSGYSSVFSLGHKALEFLWEGQVVVQEKIDGSQFSFGVVEGELLMRSRNAIIYGSDPGVFDKAVDTVMHLHAYSRLLEGVIYRAEYLRVSKHNTLAYARVPKSHLILFDVDGGGQHYADASGLAAHAEGLGLEAVPTLKVYDNQQPPEAELEALLERKSCLGGTKVEGITLKNYDQFGPGGKTLMARLVNKDFVEIHRADWKRRNPSPKQFVEQLAAGYCSEARWQKVVQHLQEAGRLEGTPRDIGLLVGEVPEDILLECRGEIADALFEHFWEKVIARQVVRGLPEWYKKCLGEEEAR